LEWNGLKGEVRDGMSGVAWHGAERVSENQTRVVRNGAAQGRERRCRGEQSGVEAAERNGTEWSGMEWDEVELNGVVRDAE